MNPSQLLSHFDRISEAPDAVPRLRRFILELAVRGKLVDQDLKDDPASYLLMRIQAENRQMENTFHPLAEDEKPFTIPQSWAWIRLGNAAHVEMGQSPPSENYNQSGDGIPFYQGKTDFGLRHPTPRYWCDLPSKLAQKNDILISVRAPVGPTNVASEECCIGRGLAALRPHHGVYLEFLLYSLKGFESAIAAMGYGTTFVAITKKQLVSFAVPLPPLAEQHRIVAKVDELMALCDRLEAAQADREIRRNRLVASSLNRLSNGVDPDAFRDHARFYFNHLPRLTTKPEHIQQLRQTILNLAVRGKLVPQDPNDEPASVLLRRIAEEKEQLIEAREIQRPKELSAIEPQAMPFRLPKGWQWAYVWDVAKIITSGSRDWAKYYSNSGPIFVTMGNLSRGDYKLRMDFLRYVNPPADGEGSRTRLEENDLLISITGDVGNLGLIPADFGEAYINQHTCLLRFMPDCQSRYFPELMRSPWAKYQFDAPQRGIKNSFRLSDVGEMLIPVPPLAEQYRIVAKVDELMALCDKLDAQLTTTQTENRRLLEAVLHEALTCDSAEVNKFHGAATEACYD